MVPSNAASRCASLTATVGLALDSCLGGAFGPAQTASADDVEVQTSPGAPVLPALGLAVEAVELALWRRLPPGYVGLYVKLSRLGDRSFEPLPVGQRGALLLSADAVVEYILQLAWQIRHVGLRDIKQ